MALHVVQWSGGIGSWATAQLVAAAHGTTDLVLLFADTLVEDEDLYRFSVEAAAQLGVPVIRVADGRTPFQVFWDQRFLGNSLLAPCSRLLKQVPCRRWLTTHADPADTVVYVGIDAAEARRTSGIERGWSPWTVRFPLLDRPELTKDAMLAWIRRLGLRPPRLYELGFPHNNCGGACVRAGQRNWLRLLTTFPDRYAAAEREEAQFRAAHGDVAILKQRRDGTSRPLTLAELRRRHQASA